MLQEAGVPYYFTTHGSYSEEQTAIAAVLVIRVTGTSLFGRNIALKRAAEVRELIEKLASAGIGEDAVTLVDVHAEAKRGVFTRASLAKYDLEVEVADLNKLIDLLVLVTTPKHTKMREIRWEYGGITDTDRWIASAVAAARQRAHAIVEALGVKIEDVHEISYGVDGLEDDRWRRDSWLDRDGSEMLAELSMDFCIDRTLEIEEAIGMGLYRTRKVGAHAEVSFTIETKRPRVVLIDSSTNGGSPKGGGRGRRGRYQLGSA